MISLKMAFMKTLRFGISVSSGNMIAFLGILLLCLPASESWLMPLPTLPKVNSRVRRHSHSAARHLRFIITDPSNEHRAAVTLLGPPLPSLAIDDKLASLQLPTDAMLKSIHHIYKVTDGIRTTDSEHRLEHLYLIPGYLLLSLDRAIHTYRRLSLADQSTSELQNGGQNGINTWSRYWFPIMTSGRGQYVVLDLSNHKLFEYDIHDQSRGFEYHNLNSFLTQYADGLLYGEIDSSQGYPQYKAEVQHHYLQEHEQGKNDENKKKSVLLIAITSPYHISQS